MMRLLSAGHTRLAEQGQLALDEARQQVQQPLAVGSREPLPAGESQLSGRRRRGRGRGGALERAGSARDMAHHLPVGQAPHNAVLLAACARHSAG
ncbi:MAG: hypothetical protein ACXVDF_25350 [Ktedonobacterales bacterium]